MRRREFLIALSAAAFIYPIAADAQQSQKTFRIAILTPAPSDQTPIFKAFRQGLHDLGYIEGVNTTIEFRSTKGNSSLLPDLAANLVGLPVDAILADGAAASQAAKDATRRIPIVIECRFLCCRIRCSGTVVRLW